MIVLFKNCLWLIEMGVMIVNLGVGMMFVVFRWLFNLIFNKV